MWLRNKRVPERGKRHVSNRVAFEREVQYAIGFQVFLPHNLGGDEVLT
jgi:hypothetical protein